MATTDYMLTTIDNPFNPFTNFNEWYKFDMMKGYDTCGYLGRLASLSNYISDELNEDEIDFTMDQIIESEPTFYKKVTKDYIWNGQNEILNNL